MDDVQRSFDNLEKKIIEKHEAAKRKKRSDVTRASKRAYKAEGRRVGTIPRGTSAGLALDKKVLRAGLQCMSRHRREGHRLVLATASPDIYVRLLGERLGFDDVICTRFQWDDSDRLTGELDGDNCYGDVKRAKVETYIDEQNYSGGLFVYTDHHSDLPLLRVATCPVAVNPTPSLKRAASELGIPIVRW